MSKATAQVMLMCIAAFLVVMILMNMETVIELFIGTFDAITRGRIPKL